MIFRISAVFLATVLAATSVFAQMQAADHKGMDMGKQPVAASKAQTHTATGTVKKADPKTGKLTLAHGPVASLNWPAMTMAFKVNDKALWQKLDEGKTVGVEFAQQGGDYVVTAVK